MTKTEIEDCMNSDKLNKTKELFNNYDTFYTRLSKLSSNSKYDVCYNVKCILHDFSNMHELLNKTKLLIRACCKISSTLMIDDAFAQICSETCKTLECDRASVFLLDDSKKELWTKIAKGNSIMIRIPSDKGIAGSVATTGQSLRIDEAYADPRFNKEVDKLNNYRTKTILCVPIKDTTTDKVIGKPL